MGCGTGRLDAKDSFRITLLFKPEISENIRSTPTSEARWKELIREKLDDWKPKKEGGKFAA